ncbi:histidine kinase [Archangium violaceum]|uniref:sensor histidine kinase n=1 Tax=Archangium violaceum TaxID=83451 RepID=UPI002B2B097C|nr:histidine kinase [Archangium gephyra]
MQDPATQRDYWLCQLAGWGAMAALGVLSSTTSDWRQMLPFVLAKSFCMVTGLELSHAWHFHLKRRGWVARPSGIPFGRVLAGLLVLAVLQMGCLLLSDLLFRGGALLRDPTAGPLDYAMLLVLWFAVFSVWTLCYAVALARRRAQRAELEKLQLEVSVKDAELRALQFQVNPHFFFNSLNSIRALIYEDAPAAAHAVSQLAGMMRQRLQAGQAGAITLGAEMAAVSAYLGIEKLRFDARLQVHIDVDAALAATPVPPMVVQTLVENAIKHGVERMVAPCEVRISAKLGDDGLVRVEVRNQGRLAASSTSTRLGLSNAVQRLALLCGPQAGCELAEEEGWVRATVTLPQGSA